MIKISRGVNFRFNYHTVRVEGACSKKNLLDELKMYGTNRDDFRKIEKQVSCTLAGVDRAEGTFSKRVGFVTSDKK